MYGPTSIFSVLGPWLRQPQTGCRLSRNGRCLPGLLDGSCSFTHTPYSWETPTNNRTQSSVLDGQTNSQKRNEGQKFTWMPGILNMFVLLNFQLLNSASDVFTWYLLNMFYFWNCLPLPDLRNWSILLLDDALFRFEPCWYGSTCSEILLCRRQAELYRYNHW